MQETHLLLANKNLSYLELAKKMLTYHDDNYAVDVAITGDECLEKIMRNNYDLVLLDYEIDDDKGLEILNKIVRSGFELPVIMMIEEGREDITFKTRY